MNIGIIGVGGVGGYFGGKLCRLAATPGINVYFVARGRHLDEILKKGLAVSSVTDGDWVCRPTLATDRIDELPVLDVCLLCVKSYDLKNAMIRIQKKVSESTFILPLLNGIDIYERIREHLHHAHVFPACVYIGTEVETYGKVVQKAGACKILLGGDPQWPQAFPDALFDLFNECLIKYEWFDNVYPAIWEKYMFIAGFGLVTASFGKTFGQIMESSFLSDYVLSVMNEIYLLSQNMNIGLPETLVSDCYQKVRNFPYDSKTSLQRDMECADKPDERDLFAGTIIRFGKRFGIDTPVTQELWDRLNRQKPLPDKWLNP